MSYNRAHEDLDLTTQLSVRSCVHVLFSPAAITTAQVATASQPPPPSVRGPTPRRCIQICFSPCSPVGTPWLADDPWRVPVSTPALLFGLRFGRIGLDLRGCFIGAALLAVVAARLTRCSLRARQCLVLACTHASPDALTRALLSSSARLQIHLSDASLL